MSAIFGVLRFDGAAVNPRELERMGNVLAHRGPDGRKFTADGPIGLGHCLLRVNNEDLFEAQPLVDREAKLTLVADARIDNREELAEAFGWSADECRDRPDSAFILEAYKRWGEDAPEHLLGDFVFAVWDGRKQKLVLARDHMGQRTVFYHLAKDFIAFGSEIKALWAIAGVPRVLCETQMGRMLVLDRAKKAGTTPFEDIAAVPGGTTMRVAAAGTIGSHCYWEPRAAPAHMNRDEAYYVAAYRRVLEEAVACRLRRTAHPAGLFFSGGFDSTAIAGLAGPALRGKAHRLVAVTSTRLGADGQTPRSNRWVELCRRDMPHLEVRYLVGRTQQDLAEFDRRFLANDGPHAASRLVSDEAYRAIASAGARLVMNGHGGDYTLNPRGQKALVRFLVTGQWRRFVAEFGPWRRHRRRSRLATVKTDIIRVLLSSAFVRAWQRSRNGLKPFGPTVPIARAFAREALAAGAEAPQGGAPGISMRPPMIKALRGQQNQAILGGTIAAARLGLVLTQPFHDKRVVELALAVPEDLYVKNGRPRYLARLALADVYPPEFQDRAPGVDDVRSDFLRVAEAMHGQMLSEIERMERDGRLTRLFDFVQMRRMLAFRGKDGLRSEPATAQAFSAILYARYMEWFSRENR